MSNGFSFISLLFLLGAAHGVFLAAALFTYRSGPRRANRYLACYTLVFVCALLDYFLDATGLTQTHVYWRTLLWPKEFLYGTLIYFYARELTSPGKYPLTGRQWLHFVPTALHIACTWPLLLYSSSFQWAVLSEDESLQGFPLLWSHLLGDIELVTTVVQITVYILMALRLTVRHQHQLLDQYANIERINLIWLRNLLLGTLAVYFCWLAEEFVHLNPAVENWLDAALGLSMVGLIYGMSFLGLRQSIPVTHGPTINQRDSTDATEPAQERYRHSAISDDMSASLFSELQATMQTTKLYQDNTLSLPKLADAMGLSANHLSQVINQQAQKNFFDYINGYRIGEVKQLMQAQPQSSVLDIAFATGFNSKSAFYTAFKKHTQQTPTQYRNSLN